MSVGSCGASCLQTRTGFEETPVRPMIADHGHLSERCFGRSDRSTRRPIEAKGGPEAVPGPGARLLKPSRLLHFLDVRQPPRLVEQRLRRCVKAEHQLELPGRVGPYSVAVLAGGRLGADVEVDRPVGVPLQLGHLRRAAGPDDALDQRVGLPVKVQDVEAAYNHTALLAGEFRSSEFWACTGPGPAGVQDRPRQKIGRVQEQIEIA